MFHEGLFMGGGGEVWQEADTPLKCVKSLSPSSSLPSLFQ